MIFEPRTDSKPIELEPPHIMEFLTERYPERLRAAIYVTRSLDFITAVGDVTDMPEHINVKIGGLGQTAKLLTRNMLKGFFQQLLDGEVQCNAGKVNLGELRDMSKRYWLLEEAAEKVTLEIVFDEGLGADAGKAE